MRAFLLALALLAPTAFAEDVGLPNGDKVRVWTESGVDRAERTNAKGELLWSVVVRPANAAAPLKIEVEHDTVRIREGELVRLLHATPEKPAKADEPPAFEALFMVQRAPVASVPSRDLAKAGYELFAEEGSAALWRRDLWVYAAFGARNAPHAIVRVAFDTGRARFSASELHGRAYVVAMNASASDDGTLTVAHPTPQWLGDLWRPGVEQRRALRDKPLPAIRAARWLQSAPIALESLRGNVVLLDFWGVWCAPCVAALPDIRKLQQALANPPFKLVTVHSAQGADKIEEFLKKRPFDAPIAIDTGETEKAYALESYPTYVLINKDGKVVRVMQTLPDIDQIRALF